MLLAAAPAGQFWQLWRALLSLRCTSVPGEQSVGQSGQAAQSSMGPQPAGWMAAGPRRGRRCRRSISDAPRRHGKPGGSATPGLDDGHERGHARGCWKYGAGCSGGARRAAACPQLACVYMTLAAWSRSRMPESYTRPSGNCDAGMLAWQGSCKLLRGLHGANAGMQRHRVLNDTRPHSFLLHGEDRVESNFQTWMLYEVDPSVVPAVPSKGIDPAVTARWLA